jgi:hypothetical protein
MREGVRMGEREPVERERETVKLGVGGGRVVSP